MKLAILIVAVLALVWLLRSTMRPRVRPPDPKPARDGASTQAMLACAHCGLHMPQDEALPGRGGVFCSEAHRSAFENPPSAP